MSPLKPDLKRFEEMKKLREEGMNSVEIAAHFNISRQRVSTLFQKYDQPMRGAVITKADILEIRDPEKLAAKFNVTVTHARKRIRDEGIYIPRKENAKWSKFTAEFVAQVYADYQSGMNQIELSKKYNIGQSTVSMLFRKFGFKTNGRGWPKGKPRGG